MMKYLFFFALVLSIMFSAYGVEISWETDLLQAKKKAQSEHKCLLIYFSAEDMGTVDHKLNEDALRSEEFFHGVGKKFVFVKIDFNQALKATDNQKDDELSTYQVDSFPTIKWATASGIPVSESVGRVTTAELVTTAEKALRVCEVLDEYFCDLGKTQTADERFKIIANILRLIPDDDEENFAPQLVEEIEKDAQDIGGIKFERSQAKLAVDQEIAWDEYISAYPEDMLGDPQKLLNITEGYLKSHDADMLPTTRQMIMQWQIGALFAAGRFVDAVPLIHRAVALAPLTKEAAQMQKDLDFYTENAKKLEEDFKLRTQFEQQAREFKVYYNSLPEDVRKNATALVDKIRQYDADETLLPESHQQIRYVLFQTLMKALEYDEAVAALQSAIDIAPGSSVVSLFEDELHSVQENKEDILKGMATMRANAKENPQKEAEPDKK